MRRWVAVCVALFVTFLWSTSYILNKWAFADGIGPMTLAGLRYSLAAITLGIAKLATRRQATEATRPPTVWQFAGLGIAGYLVAQGFQYVGQYFVTPTQTNMVLAVGNTSLVLLAGAIWLGELPSTRQGWGIGLALSGIVLYNWGFRLQPGNLAGIGMLLLSGIGYAIQTTASRSLLGRKATTPLDLTLYPMAVGGAGMLILGLSLETLPVFSLKLLGLLLWLAVLNAALGFFLWNIALRSLQAFEISILANTMLLQTALMDVLLLGRSIDARKLTALAMVTAGILTVQTAKRKLKAPAA